MTNFEIWRQGLTANYFLQDIDDVNPTVPEETIFENCVGCPVRCYRNLAEGQTCADKFLEWAGRGE